MDKGSREARTNEFFAKLEAARVKQSRGTYADGKPREVFYDNVQLEKKGNYKDDEIDGLRHGQGTFDLRPGKRRAICRRKRRDDKLV